ncbi:MAG: hypothetical protein M1830_000456 [Pleopsidium flavum]|nr:MAG: hypothetical protein M1830_000456 [Pleopsidium flavum]
MLLDTHLTWAEIHPSGEDMKRQMLDVYTHRIGRNSLRDQTIRRRYLAPAEGFATACRIFSWSNKHSCPTCKFHRPFPRNSSLRRLRLTDSAEFEECREYVAVSYCWGQQGGSRDPAAGGLDATPYLVQTKQAVREARNPSVLEKAIKYAADHDVGLIWIDQDCIQQDNAQEKEEQIQSMHMVYRMSNWPLPWLGTRTTHQAYVNALIALMDKREVDSSLTGSVIDLMDLIGRNLYFTRAWTLQEAMSAESKIVVSIPCDLRLEQTNSLGSTAGEIQLEAPEELEDAPRAKMKSAMHHLVNTCFTQGGSGNLSSAINRWIMNAAKATSYLDLRKNTRVPHRIAILGNMCGYRVRLSTVALEPDAYSFSTCALALALLNGDTSLLNGYREAALGLEGDQNSVLNPAKLCEIASSADKHAEPQPHGFSWCPPRTGRLAHLPYTPEKPRDTLFRLRTVAFESRGLLTDGFLWMIDTRIDLPGLKEQFAKRWHYVISEGLDDRNRSAVSSVATEIVCSLLQELTLRGVSTLAEAVCGFVMPNMDRGGHCVPATYTTIEDERGQMSTYSKVIDTKGEDENQIDVDPRLFLAVRLIEQIMKQGMLRCGHLVDEDGSKSPSQAHCNF